MSPPTQAPASAPLAVDAQARKQRDEEDQVTSDQKALRVQLRAQALGHSQHDSTDQRSPQRSERPLKTPTR